MRLLVLLTAIAMPLVAWFSNNGTFATTPWPTWRRGRRASR